jgi:hypothetical protein
LLQHDADRIPPPSAYQESQHNANPRSARIPGLVNKTGPKAGKWAGGKKSKRRTCVNRRSSSSIAQETLRIVGKCSKKENTTK